MNQIDNFLDCFLKIIKKFLIRILSFDILLKHVMCAMIFGPLVKWDNTSFASLDQEFDSPRVHQLYGSVAQSGQSNRLIPGVSRVQIPPLLPTKLKKLIKKFYMDSQRNGQSYRPITDRLQVRVLQSPPTEKYPSG